MWRGLTVALVAMLTSALALSACDALAEGGTRVLLADEHLVLEVPRNGSAPVWASYCVRVIEGPPVNVWVVDGEGLAGYLDDNASVFPHLSDLSSRETHLAEARFSVGWNGSAYIVVDNHRNAGHGQHVRFEYRVDHGEELPLVPTGSPHLLAVLGLVTVGYAALFAFLTVRSMRRLIERRESEDGWLSSPGGDDG